MGDVRRSAYREPVTPEGIRGIENRTLERFDDDMFANLNTGVLEQYLEDRNRTESFELSHFNLKKVLLMIILVGLPFTLITQYATLKTGVMLGGAFYITYIIGLGLKWSPTEINISAGAATAAEKTITGFVFTFPAIYILASAGFLGDYEIVSGGSFSSFPMMMLIIICSIVSSFLGLMYMVVLRRLWIVEDPLPTPGFQATVKLLHISDTIRLGGTYELKGTFKKIGYSVLGMVLLGTVTDLPLIKIGKYVKPLIDGLFHSVNLGRWINDGIIRTPPRVSVLSRPSFEISGLLFAVGWFLRKKGAAVILFGSLLSWFVMVPSAVILGLPIEVNPIDDSGPMTIRLNDLSYNDFPLFGLNINSSVSEVAFGNYIHPVAIGVILGAGLVAIFKVLPGLTSILRRSRKTDSMGDPGIERNEERYEVPKRFVIPAVLAAFLTIILTFPLFGGFDIFSSVILGLVLIPITIFLSAVSVKIIGEIGLSPTSIISILLVFVLIIILRMLLSPSGDERWDIVLMVLLSTTIFLCTMALSADLILDFKAGLYAGTRPYHLMKGQTIGILLGISFAGFFAYLLSGLVIKGPGLAPQARMLADTVVWVISGEIPWNLLGLGLFIGIFVELLTGLGTAFAIGMFVPFQIPLGIFIGAAGRDLWEKKWLMKKARTFRWTDREITIKTLDSYMVMVGLIIGEALFGAVSAIFLILTT